MRSALLLMMTFPGKKMMFMGTEFAQFREWDYQSSLEWFMLDYPNHRAIREYTAALNRFYLETKELWEIDFSNEGFEWILPDESEKNLIAYKRLAKNGEYIVAVINFSGNSQIVTFDSPDIMNTVFDTGDKTHQLYSDNKITLTLPKYSGLILKPERKQFLSGRNECI